MSQSTVLAAPIRVVNQSWGRPPLLHLAKERPGRQVLGHAFPHGIANNLASKDILQTCQIEPAFVHSDVSPRRSSLDRA